MVNQDYTTIVLNLASEIDQLNQSFVTEGYNSISMALAKPIGTLCVLFIMLTGYSILRGLIKTPMQEFVKVAIRIGVVYMLALNWGNFSSYFVSLFVDGASWMGGLMMKLRPFNVPMPKGSGVNGGLQSVFTETMSIGAWAANKGTWRHPGPYFTGGFIDLAGFMVVGLAFFELTVAKLMTSICLVMAPLFISFTLFEKTRSYFDKWLGSLIGFALVLVFVSAVVGFCMNLLHWSIGQNYTNHADSMLATGWIPLLFVAGLSVKAILEVTAIAKSIGGSCCTGSGSAMVGGFMGSALRMSKGASKMTGLTKLMSLGGGAVKNAAGKGMKRAGSAAMRGIQKRLRGG